MLVIFLSMGYNFRKDNKKKYPSIISTSNRASVPLCENFIAHRGTGAQ